MNEEQQIAYRAGYDSGKNGANLINCNFRHFSSPEKTKAWEQGKEAAEQSLLK